MKRIIEKIGQHPFVTGVLAILGFGGFLLSVVGFSADRKESSETSTQIDQGFANTSQTLESGLKNSERTIESSFESTNKNIDKSAEAIKSVDSTLKQQSLAREGSYQEGTYLYEDPVEGVYSNFWTAYVNKTKPSPELTIRGEGKAVEFSGVVTLNCDNGRYSWNGGTNFSTPLSEEQVIALVPKPAMRAAVRIFCWDKL